MIDIEIIRAVAALRRLLTKRCDLRSEQNNAHDIMHRLPLELKHRIFELVLPIQDEWGITVQIRWPMGHPPSYLTSICRNWRDIARSNPFLWSTLPIVLGAPSTLDPSWADFVYDWIERSRTLPLTLHITIYDNDGSEDDVEEGDLETQLNDILDVMSECPNEWQSLSLEIPFSFLHLFHFGYDDYKSHLLTVRRLRIVCTDDWEETNQPAVPTMNPEKIEIDGLPFKSLHVSWNHLTSAKVRYWDLEDVTQLLQHASQMTSCAILHPDLLDPDFSVPPIIHRGLQTLRWRDTEDATRMLLDSLTLPCLHTAETDAVTVAHLPSLVHRSSCPLTRLTLWEISGLPSNLPPIPGVTDLVLAKVHGDAMLKELLLNGYFPDLRHLTLPLQAFVVLWKSDVISLLLDRNRPRPDAPNEITLRTIFVVDLEGAESDPLSDPEFLKTFQSSISVKEGGFEILIPEVQRGGEDG
jgi:hypothetical protein